MKAVFKVIFISFYSIMWFCALFLIFGFFLPTPVRVGRAIFGYYRKNNVISNKRNTSSRYGISDDKELDEMMFYDTMDD